MSKVVEHRFDNAQALTGALSDFVQTTLNEAIKARGQASLVVSGGRTPGALFEALSTCPIEWAKVWITLADERWLDSNDADSNERLVRSALLKDRAGQAHFVALKNAAATPELGASQSSAAVGTLPRPFDLVLLGLGDDGHTASLFPGAPELADGLAAEAPACVAIHPPSAPYPRMSQSAASLLASRAIVFLIEGALKWETYQRVRKPGAIAEFPSRAFLLQDKIPVHVYWSR